MKFTFKLISPCYQDAKSRYRSSNRYDFYLEEDYWDDFSYHTTYHLHSTGKLDNGEVNYLGSIKIMRKGQKEGEKFLLDEVFKKEDGVFNCLPEDFYSISFSIELFREIHRLLKDPQDRKDWVAAMRLILSDRDALYGEVMEDACFGASLLRGASMSSFSLQYANKLINSEHVSYDLLKQRLTVTFPDLKEPFDIQFSTFEHIAKGETTPSRIVAFIGRNGTGKSTMLYRLAKILYASPQDRPRYAEKCGEVSPSDVGFTMLFVVSYSVFDNFVLPGATLRDYRQILSGIESYSGRFCFCGIRDIKAEYQRLVDQLEKGENLDSTSDRTKEPCLKSLRDLDTEFARAFEVIEKDLERTDLLRRLANEIEDEVLAKFFDSILDPWFFIDVPDSEEAKKKWSFLNLSTGHKFVAHSLVSILAYIEEDSFILFDEPENHLHPPLLAAYLKCIRIIAERYNSLVLVATHSPIILQETLSDQVFVVRRDGEALRIVSPSIQTFGESFGVINSEVFNLNTDRMPYYKFLDRLVKVGTLNHGNKDEVLRNVMSNFKKGMSEQALAYVISKIYEDVDAGETPDDGCVG